MFKIYPTWERPPKMPPLNRRKSTELPDTPNHSSSECLSFTQILCPLSRISWLSALLSPPLYLLQIRRINKEDKIYTTLLRVNEGDTYMTFN